MSITHSHKNMLLDFAVFSLLSITLCVTNNTMRTHSPSKREKNVLLRQQKEKKPQKEKKLCYKVKRNIKIMKN